MQVVQPCMWQQSGFRWPNGQAMLLCNGHCSDTWSYWNRMGLVLIRGLYYHGSTLPPAWISHNMSCKVWDEITYPFPNFNGCTVEFGEWIGNFTLHFVTDVITYSEGWGFESPSGRDIFCLKNFDTFTRTLVRVSKMNAVDRAELTFKVLTLLQKYPCNNNHAFVGQMDKQCCSVMINGHCCDTWSYWNRTGLSSRARDI